MAPTDKAAAANGHASPRAAASVKKHHVAEPKPAKAEAETQHVINPTPAAPAGVSVQSPAPAPAPTDKAIKITTQTPGEQIQTNIQEDLKSGVLTFQRGKTIPFTGIKLTSDYYVYHADVDKKIHGAESSLGCIKNRYGLEDGILKEANGLYFDSIGGDEMNKGANLNKYYPSDLIRQEIYFPVNEANKNHKDFSLVEASNKKAGNS